MLASRFRRQRLAYTRRTVKVNDEAVSLALHEVVKSKICIVRFHERLKHRFSSRRKDKISERFIIPFDGRNKFNVEFHCTSDFQLRTDDVDKGYELTPKLVGQAEAI